MTSKKPAASKRAQPLDDRLGLETVDGNIVLKPSAKTYALQDMLAKINDQNQHALLDFGAPVGREK